MPVAEGNWSIGPLLVALGAGCGAEPARATLPTSVFASPEATAEAVAPGRQVQQVIEAALQSDRAYADLRVLSDEIGHRLSGSLALARAVDWAAERLREDGLAVTVQPVKVPHWQRGPESGAWLLPVSAPLRVLQLGGSVSQAPVEADVIVVQSFEELTARAPEVAGKIVVFHHDFSASKPAGDEYGRTVKFRTQGASEASKLGAVASLVRSITGRSLSTLHTGSTGFAPGVKPIPAAAITIEDADRMLRLARSGKPIRLRLDMQAQWLDDADSANVIADLPGGDLANEVVLVGGHLDSWDVGQGAHDDGAGCVMAMASLRLVHQLGIVPRRTLRAVLFTNEENGLRGARAYAKQFALCPAPTCLKHVAGIESDGGSFEPEGFSLQGVETALPLLSQYVAKLSALGPLNVVIGGSGADLTPLEPLGIPLLGHRVDGAHYFDYHHTDADTFDKVDPMLLRKNVAAVAAMALALANHPEPLPVGKPTLQ